MRRLFILFILIGSIGYAQSIHDIPGKYRILNTFSSYSYVVFTSCTIQVISSSGNTIHTYNYQVVEVYPKKIIIYFDHMYYSYQKDHNDICLSPYCVDTFQPVYLRRVK